MIKKILLSLTILLFVSSCTKNIFSQKYYDADIIEENHKAAEYLLKESAKNRGYGFRIQQNKPLIAATFVNINDVQKSSPLGRMVAEQIASYFTGQGYSVIELRLRSSIFVQQQNGELMLSRKIQDISFEHDAQAIIVGTYTPAKEGVFVTAKLVRSTDGITVASYDYKLPMGPDTKSMLRERKRSRRQH
jgi:TolB-like protein